MAWEYEGAAGQQFTTDWIPTVRCRLESVVVDGGTLDRLVVNQRLALLTPGGWSDSPVLEPGRSMVRITHTQQGTASRVELTWRRVLDDAPMTVFERDEDVQKTPEKP